MSGRSAAIFIRRNCGAGTGGGAGAQNFVARQQHIVRYLTVLIYNRSSLPQHNKRDAF
jgi:hypothetical protein